MTWLNPIVLLGLVALGVPVLIHLFGRRLARRLKFPSLRLMGDAMTTPTSRRVPSDLLLLVVRCAIVVAAVLALAQPLFRTSSRVRQAQRPVRVILVDSSESMRRLTSTGETMVAAARDRGLALLDSSRTGTIIESANAGASLAGAASWLESQSGFREVVIVSDFQVGTLHEGQVAAVPTNIGVRLERVTSTERVPVAQPMAVDSIRVDSSGTYASWPAGMTDSLPLPVLLGSTDELTRLETDSAAVRLLFRRPLRSSGRVAVVFPGHPARADRLRESVPLDSPWQGDLLLSLRRDEALAEIMRTTTVTGACELSPTVVATNGAGIPLVSINRGRPGSPHEMLVFTCVDAGSLAATALLAALARGMDSVPPLTELEPLSLPDEMLRRWQREPVASAPRGSDETSPDGRWLWLAALALLGVEEWLRRRTPRRQARPEPEVARARVA